MERRKLVKGQRMLSRARKRGSAKEERRESALR
jgi:hypothetical protein